MGEWAQSKASIELVMLDLSLGPFPAPGRPSSHLLQQTSGHPSVGNQCRDPVST